MRRFMLALIGVLSLVSIAAAQETSSTSDAPAGDSRETKPSVRFDGRTLELAFEGTNPGEIVKEFIVNGQSLDDWTALASIREYPELTDPRLVVGKFRDLLKQQYPDSPSAIHQNPTTGEVMFDFVLWPKDGSFVEFNVFKYHQSKEGHLVAEQYAVREYDNPEDFLRGLREVRQRLIEEMAAEGLQPAQPNGN